MERYYRPIPIQDVAQDPESLPLAGTRVRFRRLECLERGRPPTIVEPDEVPSEWLERLTQTRGNLLGVPLSSPRLMGICNVTPDSFSDGGQLDSASALSALRERFLENEIEIADVGGESTRPGAEPVSSAEEIRRISNAVADFSSRGLRVSVDTRKANVASAAIRSGAQMVNDVSGLRFDPDLAAVVADAGVPICLMHSRGTPETMSGLAGYTDVLLDTFDELEARIAFALNAGIPRSNIVCDPGIGFAKTAEQNLALLRRLSLFHGLGVPLLLGASRKRFIGTYGGAEKPEDRMPGSLAVTLAGIGQGVQIHRVHDLAATRQVLKINAALQSASEE